MVVSAGFGSASYLLKDYTSGEKHVPIHFLRAVWNLFLSLVRYKNMEPTKDTDWVSIV